MERRLSVDPVLQRFQASQEDAFKAALETSDRHAVFYPLHDVKEVLLGPDGTTTSGSRFTNLALFQLCHSTCPGLYRFILELAGVHREDGAAPKDFSLDEAIDTLNKVIKRRFETRLAGKQLLRNTNAKLIEGLVGAKYRRLANLDLYTRARDASADTAFYEGSISGRWMLLRLYGTQPLFVAGDPGCDGFYGGFHFSNNEVGKGAVKAAPFIVRTMGRTCALAKFVSGATLRHWGDAFGTKLTKMLRTALARTDDPVFYARAVDRLRDTLLGLGQPVPDKEEARRQDLVHFLTRNRVRVGLATRIVGSMLAQGSYDKERIPLAQVDRKVLATRDVYDLFNAIGREAKRMPIGVREQAEQVAHALLTGKINIPQPTR